MLPTFLHVHSVLDCKKILSKCIFVITMMSLCHAYALKPNSHRRIVLVDTGYDLCHTTINTECENNRNLLFRGMTPVPYERDQFLQNVMYYLQLFKRVYHVNAKIPDTLEELNNYRIVMINVGYGRGYKHVTKELQALQDEYKYAVPSSLNSFPKEHTLYSMDFSFNPNHYAFEWWPITLNTIQAVPKPDLAAILNWSDKKNHPLESKPLNLPYLITGQNFFTSHEENSQSIYELLNTIPKDGHPLLIFYHCMSGVDRTGVVTMSYFLAYGGYPYITSDSTKTSAARLGPMNFSQALAAMNMKPNHRALRLTQVFCFLIKKDNNECAMPPMNVFKDEAYRFFRRIYKKIFLVKH
jgi:hypothetical protein